MSNVRGFREIVGPNGEISYEFASNSESSESSEDEDYVPPTAALARRNAIPNLDTATDWAENLNNPDFSEASNLSLMSNSSNNSSRFETPAAAGTNGSQPSRIGNGFPGFSRLIIDPISDELIRVPDRGEIVDPSIFQALHELENNTDSNDSDTGDSEMEMLAPPVMPLAGRTRSRRGVPRRTTRRRRRPTAKKKKKSTKPPAPPKPLVPLTIREKVTILGGREIQDIKQHFRFLKVAIPENPSGKIDSQAEKSTAKNREIEVIDLENPEIEIKPKVEVIDLENFEGRINQKVVLIDLENSQIKIEPEAEFIKPANVAENSPDIEIIDEENLDTKIKQQEIPRTLPHQVRNTIPGKNNLIENPKRYKMGSVEVFLEEDFFTTVFHNQILPLSFTSKNFPRLFPHAVSLSLTIHNDIQYVLFKRERMLSEEESAGVQPPPGPKYRNRKLNYINVEHFYFKCDVRGDLPLELFDGLRTKSVNLNFNCYSHEDLRLRLDILLAEEAILVEHDLEGIPFSAPKNLKNVFGFLFGVEGFEKSEPQEKEDIEWFYGQVRKYHSSENLPMTPVDLQHPNMKPKLRDYQKDAVRWMLYKEGAFVSAGENSNSAIQKNRQITQNFLDKMSVPIQLEDPDDPSEESKFKPAFYNPYAGYVSWCQPKIPEIPSGGVLADEMGLGKTVETLALILLNPCPPDKCENNIYDDDSIIDNNYKKGKSILPKKIRRKIVPDDSESEDLDWKPESDSEDERSKRKKPKAKGRKKKSPSPCEFEVHNFEGEDGKQNHKEQSDKNVNVNFQTTKSGRKTKRLVISSDEDSECAQPVKNSGKRKISKNSHNSKKLQIFKNSAKKQENTENNEQSELGPSDKETPGPSRNCRILDVSVNSDDIISTPQNAVAKKKSKTGRKPRKIRKTSSTEDVCPDPNAKVRTYDRVKVLYDAALSEYSAAGSAHSSGKFHGTFFDTTIQRKEIFECLCGDGITNSRRRILECRNCLSSQHADCVNFDWRRGPSNYLCPHCEVSCEPIPVKTTLIVTPATISHQWIDEIRRHILNKHLKILFYRGVSKHGYMPPYKFADYDMVITTYAVLSADLSYVDLPHTNSEDGRKFRRAKRFLTTPSSLASVLWWRVCLDEGQMVEGMATKMALMASRLQGVHRWCITGTPLNKGLEDLHGLMAFLGVFPISEDRWWEVLVRAPFHKKDTSLLFELFGHTIWRTGKRAVLAQLGIPKQTEAFHWLQFSPVEMHFYKRQFETCSSKITAKIVRLKQLHGNGILHSRLSALDRQTLHSLLQPFLELRQACCHPQMVRGNVLSLHKFKEGAMTMEDLLDMLMKKTKIQCADDHRLVIAALNGLAGLYILNNRWGEAADQYRGVLQSAEKNKDKFPTDSLQLLHALENLADLLDGSHADVGFTLNDSKLRPQAAEIRQKYLEKYAEAVQAAQDVVNPVTNLVIELMENFCCKTESWWFTVLRRAVVTKKDEDLISRIKDDLTYKAKMYKRKTISIANSFNDTFGLQGVMIRKIQELEDERDHVLGGLQELLTTGSENFVEAAVFCHLRGQAVSYYKPKSGDADRGFRCMLCKYHDRFLDYEAHIFSAVENIKINRTGRNRQINNFTGRSNSELTSEERAMILMREEEELIETLEHVNVNILEDQRRQTWADSDVEKIIKSLANFAKLNGCSVAVIDDGTNHVKIFEALKKEFRLLRILWRQVYDQVSAIDELSQATTRLRIQAEGEQPQRVTSPKKSTIKALSSGITEKADKILNIHVLQRHEIDLKIEQIQGDYEMGKDSLSIHMGQLIYLESLKKNGYGKRGAFNSDDCPVCANPLGHQWCVLICGHSYCSDCIKELCSRNPAQSFQCPLCRAAMKLSTVSFIDTRMIDDEGNDASAGPSTSQAVLPATKAVEVKGSHSTKVEAIVETLLKLQESHPGEKCLIFSTWTDVLEIVAHALEANDIQHCMLVNTSKFKFHQIIERFKNREDIQALLIPLQSGSKGLNLIEATHILLVEPIFNLASELQAIGRVHRIGQTKPTFVHRFYVKNTIEEQLFEILKKHDVSSDDEGLLTIGDLQQLISKGSGALDIHNRPTENPTIIDV